MKKVSHMSKNSFRVLMIMSLLLFFNLTASATSWVQVTDQHTFIDKDTVTKDGDMIFYWDFLGSRE